MRYMMLIYSQENQAAHRSAEDTERIMAGHRAVISDAQGRGILEGSEPLAATNQAVTVREHEGKMLVTDGPFAETKEQLAGYYILECKDMEEAIAWAKRIPTGCGGGKGCIEVRPLRMSAAGELVQQVMNAVHG